VARFQFFRSERNLVQWRLLAGNNRVLGVSIQTFPEHASALAEVEIIRKYAADADYEVEHASAGQWWWRLSVPDPKSSDAPPLAEAASGRGFARRMDALLAVDRFRQRACDAEPDWSLAVFRPGRRGREIPVDRPPSRPDQPDPGGGDRKY
jgi:uncharacterized protein YegP (UPF0339 family)